MCKILELIVPLMEHPNPKFLAELEEDSMKLMLKQSQAVVQCSASCLASIINNVTHNFKFIVDAFNKFYSKFNFLLWLSVVMSLRIKYQNSMSISTNCYWKWVIFINSIDFENHDGLANRHKISMKRDVKIVSFW